MTLPDTRKRWIPALAAALTAAFTLLAAGPAQAQDGVLHDIEQNAVVQYGERLQFQVSAQSDVRLIGARVTVATPSGARYTSEPLTFEARTSVILTQNVAVDALGLPPFTDLQFQWVLIDEAGGEHVTPWQQTRYEDTSAPWMWQVTSGNNVHVYTDGRDPLVSRAALETAQSALTQSSRRTGAAFVGDVHLYVYPDLASMANSLRLHNRTVQDRVAAYALPAQRVALVTASPGAELLYHLERDVPHEMMHIVIGAAAGENAQRVPGWFSEGMALTNSQQPDPALRSMLDDAVRGGTLLPLDTLCVQNFGGMQPQDSALAYAQSASIVRYVTNRYGSAAIQALMAQYAAGATCENGAQQALGLSLAELERQWHNDLLSQAARAPGRELTLTPWLVVWAISMGLALLFVAPQPGQSSSTATEAPSNRTLEDNTPMEGGF